MLLRSQAGSGDRLRPTLNELIQGQTGFWMLDARAQVITARDKAGDVAGTRRWWEGYCIQVSSQLLVTPVRGDPMPFSGLLG